MLGITIMLLQPASQHIVVEIKITRRWWHGPQIGSVAPADEILDRQGRQGWGAKADNYNALAGQITGGAVAPLLDATGVQAGTQILAKDVTMPSGSTLQVPDDALIVNVTAAPTAEQLDADLTEAGTEPRAEGEAAAPGGDASGAGQSEASPGE